MKREIPESFVPPIQCVPGANLSETIFSSVENSAPFYQFVTIRQAGDSNIEIWSSKPALSRPELSEDTYVENVVQTYSVQIPYTDQQDGKLITKFRTEHRNRTVAITKFLPKTDTPKEDLIEETYTVSVPYTEHLDSGTTMTRSRLESRTRLVDPNEVPHEVTTVTDSTLEPLANVTFYDRDGKQIARDIELDEPDATVPAVQIASAGHITGYFSQLLSNDAVFFVVSRSDENLDAVD